MEEVILSAEYFLKCQAIPHSQANAQLFNVIQQAASLNVATSQAEL
jgi:hypothetical protein